MNAQIAYVKFNSKAQNSFNGSQMTDDFILHVGKSKSRILKQILLANISLEKMMTL